MKSSPTEGDKEKTPYWMSTDKIIEAIKSLEGTAGGYFRWWLVLKLKGLEPGHEIRINTKNTKPQCDKLLKIQGFSNLLNVEKETPYYDPFVNESLKHDMPRSIIQTNVKKIKDETVTTFNPEWIKIRSVPHEGREKPFGVAYRSNYLRKLGEGLNGLALREDTKVAVPLKEFMIWFYRYESFEQKLSYNELRSKFKEDLNLNEGEIRILFKEEDASLEENTFSLNPVNENRLANFVVNRLGEGKVEQPANICRNPWSHRKKEKILRAFKPAPDSKPGDSLPCPEEELKRELEERKNVLAVGPPGTGKTYTARIVGRELVKDDSDLYFFQFHRSYSYEYFVESLEPVSEGGKAFEFRPIAKPFLEICHKARDMDDKIVIILDEINRAGELSEVLGDIISLLEPEYRGPEHRVRLLYSGDEFYLPGNIFIIGTMNEIDRSTEDLDYMTRRRFSEVQFRPRADILREMLTENRCAQEDIDIICSLLISIQDYYPLGHTYFKDLRSCKELNRLYRTRINPSIRSYLGPYEKDSLKEIDELFKKASERELLE